MSVKLIGLVLGTGLPTSEKLLLLVLADAASEEGICWPRQEILAARSSLSDRSVRRILDDLRSRGLVSWEQRGLHRSNVYSLDVELLSGLAGPDTMTAPASPDRTPVAGHERTPTSGPSGTVSRTVSQTHKRDPIFETVSSVCGIDWTLPMTRSQRGQINKAAKELREIEADPEAIVRVAAAYRIRWPSIDLTPNALVKHWGTATAPLPASPETAAMARRRLAPPPSAREDPSLGSGEPRGSSSV